MVANQAVLITRPNHDLPTKYLFAWAGSVVVSAKKNKFKVIDLRKKKANLKNLTKGLNAKPKLVFLNGHGSQDCLTGYDNRPMITAGENENILRGTITYTCSCETAAQLGPACIKSGTIAYFGYKKPMYLCYSASYTKKPLKDKLAALFLDPSNLIPLSLIDQQTTRQSYTISQKQSKSNLLFMLSDKATKTERDSAPYLWSNINCQVLLGDKKTSV